MFMDFLNLNPWIHRKDIKKTDVTNLKTLMNMALEENPEANLSHIALYIINVSKHWQFKGYNETLMAVSTRYKEDQVDKMRREARKKKDDTRAA